MTAWETRQVSGRKFEKGSRIVRESGIRFLKGEDFRRMELFLEIKRSVLWLHVTKVHEGIRPCVSQDIVKLGSTLGEFMRLLKSPGRCRTREQRGDS